MWGTVAEEADKDGAEEALGEAEVKLQIQVEMRPVRRPPSPHLVSFSTGPVFSCSFLFPC